MPFARRRGGLLVGVIALCSAQHRRQPTSHLPRRASSLKASPGRRVADRAQCAPALAAVTAKARLAEQNADGLARRLGGSTSTTLSASSEPRARG